MLQNFGFMLGGIDTIACLQGAHFSSKIGPLIQEGNDILIEYIDPGKLAFDIIRHGWLARGSEDATLKILASSVPPAHRRFCAGWQ